MRLEGLKIAVTGGAGFIGSHLVDRLLGEDGKKNRVVVFDNLSSGSLDHLAQHEGNPFLEIVRGDVRDAHAIEEAFKGVDVVFHLATHCVRLSLTDPATNHAVNATGTLNTLIAARNKSIKRLIYCSSSEVYGNVVAWMGQKGGTLTEDSAKMPTTVYGASKLVGEYYTLAYHQTYGLETLVIRPFNTYGPRSHLFGPYGEVIPRFVAMMRSGKNPVIFGDGLQTRDFTYVSDTVTGLVAGAECDKLVGDSVNIAHGTEISVLSLAKHLSEILGVDFQPKHRADRPGDIRRLGADVSKAARLFGFKATAPIRDGLARYVSWLDSLGLDYGEITGRLLEENWVEAR